MSMIGIACSFEPISCRRRARRGPAERIDSRFRERTLQQKSLALPDSFHIVAVFFMASVKPFRALRPDPKQAAEICELPYDVMSSEEARQIAAGRPLSFLHVSKPEIDLPAGTDLYSPQVYAKGK